MRVLAIVHEEDAGPGVFNDVFAATRAQTDIWLVAAEADPPPAGDHDAIMIFGGSAHPDQEDRHPWLADEKRFLAAALERRVPLLGICLGAELIAEVAGAPVRRMPHPEIGWYEVRLTAEGASDPVLGPIGESFAALEWHSYEVPLPPSATALAAGPNCLQAYRVGSAWGLQFHAEVTARDFQYWLDHYTSDADAVAEGIDPVAIAHQSAPRMGAWNTVGQGICERFLRVAAEAGGPGSHV